MSNSVFKYAIIAAVAFTLSGCKTTGKVVSAPFKGAYAVGKTTGKVAYGTGKVAYGTGKLAYGGTKLATKGIVMVGKGVYYVGSVPVHVTDAALDSATRVVRITTEMVDLSGKVVSVYRDVQSAQLQNELLKYKGAKNVIKVFVDAIM